MCASVDRSGHCGQRLSLVVVKLPPRKRFRGPRVTLVNEYAAFFRLDQTFGGQRSDGRLGTANRVSEIARGDRFGALGKIMQHSRLLLRKLELCHPCQHSDWSVPISLFARPGFSADAGWHDSIQHGSQITNVVICNPSR